MKARTALYPLAAAALAIGPGVLLSPVTAAPPPAGTSNSIVDIAAGAGRFNTLVAALGATGLDQVLAGEGPFTVFAPTDAAFAKLPPGTVETLLLPENQDLLASILLYHVVPGTVTAAEVVTLDFAQTVNGQRVDINLIGGEVLIDRAKLLAADIFADNGVIHVIDSVLLPVTTDLPETLASFQRFNTLLAAVGAAELAEVLGSPGPFTIFAPTDDAFDLLPEGTLESLLLPENKDLLTNILLYHVVAGRVYSDEVLAAGQLQTLQGSDIVFGVRSEQAFANDAALLALDNEASNGVFHVIDQVLIP
jgi:transforming growth factor-beta-induced protein